MKIKIIKITIRRLACFTSSFIIGNCLLLNNGHTNQSTKKSKGNLSIKNRTIYGKKHIHRDTKEQGKI